MLTRIISAIVGIILAGYIINAGGWIFFASVCILNISAIHELKNAFEKNDIHIAFFLSSAFTCVQLYVILHLKEHIFYLSPLIMLFAIISIFLYSIINNGKNTMVDAIFSLFSFLYPSFLFMYFLLIRNMPLGIYLVWWVFITTWACDSGAYFIGIFLGKTKLAPDISPNKTIEGSLGGIVFSALVCFFFAKFLLPNIAEIDTIICGILIGVFSQVGDLSASMIKRYCKIKDFSNIIPGHGGILDRFDSALFSFPIAYFYIVIVIQKGGLL